MYDNISDKIKLLAKVMFVIEAVAAVITGIALMTSDEDGSLVGFLVMILGPIIAWASSWILYGFGHLIENSDIIAEEYQRKNDKYQKAVFADNQRKMKQHRKVVKAMMSDASVDEDEYIDVTCPNCKEELSYTKAQLQNEELTVCPMCDTPIVL